MRLESSSSLSQTERPRRGREAVAAYCPRSTGIAHFRNAYCIVYPLDNVQKKEMMYMYTCIEEKKTNFQLQLHWNQGGSKLKSCMRTIVCFIHLPEEGAFGKVIFGVFEVVQQFWRFDNVNADSFGDCLSEASMRSSAVLSTRFKEGP